MSYKLSAGKTGGLDSWLFPTQYALFSVSSSCFESRDTLNMECIFLSIRDIFEHNFMDFVFQNTENKLN